ncbi:MAG: hypothetical protein CVT48_06985 [Thermoplasmata archaeon HGW-Thermoplasmata-1]|nr:MAG: hypothetical protein CVT48_06985 [Thermoplasmata archaeon HGW-Thermoplasmata-1]
MMTSGIGTDRDPAFAGGFGKYAGIIDQRIDRRDAGVEVLLNGVEVAVVVVSDLRRNFPPGDPVDILGRHAQGSNDRIQQTVHPINGVFVHTYIF